jgi:hypothetical protein
VRKVVLTLAIMALGAAPASAQLTALYKGVQREGDKVDSVTTQFSIEPGRVAMIMTGSKSNRMVFLEKEQVLRIINDAEKSYLDMGKQTLEATSDQVNSQMAMAQKELEGLPPEQRKMAEAMMQNTMSATSQSPQVEYVRTDEKQTINGYVCTRVEARRGKATVSEYWGTTSGDFKMSEADHKTVLAMQDYLRNFTLQVRSADDGGTRAFQWDTSVEGFPIISRCFRGDITTLDIKLESFNRRPLPKDLFEVPSDYAKKEMPGLDMKKPHRGR